MTVKAAPGVAIVVASNDPAILAANLAASPMVQSGQVPLHVEENPPSAAIAYNRALDATDAEVVVFAHHDVFLPAGWDRLLARRLAELEQHDPDWALLGSYGVAYDRRGFGPVWSSSLGVIVGTVSAAPVAVQSYDEMLIVLRRSSGLRFDEALPGFHMYGTDIVQSARAAGKGAYVLPLPLIHNDRFHDNVGEDFVAAYRFMQRKWRSRLPLATPVIKVSWHGLELRRARRINAGSAALRQGFAASNQTDPRIYAAACSWEDVAPKD